MPFPISEPASGNGAAHPDQDEKGEVLDNHAAGIMDETAGPQESVRIEHDEQGCLRNGAKAWRNSSHHPYGEREFHDTQHLQEGQPESRAQPWHCCDNVELRLHSAEELAPQALVEPNGRDAGAYEN